MPVTLDREADMAKVIRRGKINQAYREITALYGDIDVEIRFNKPDLREKQTPTVSRWQNFLKEAETVDISDDTLEHIQACSKEFRANCAFKHDLA